MEQSEFILSQTTDKDGWIISDKDGEVMVSWRHGHFISTLQVFFSSTPSCIEERATKADTMRRMSKWLAHYRPDLLIP